MASESVKAIYEDNNNLFNNNKVYTIGALRQLSANQVALQGRSPMHIVFVLLTLLRRFSGEFNASGIVAMTKLA